MADAPAETPPVTRQINWPSARRQHLGDEPTELRDASSRLVVDAAGEQIPFGALYKLQKTIVVFVRHFLCYACKEYVEDLAKIPKEFLQGANVRLVVIGQSSHLHIKPFCHLTGYPHEMFVDPKREIYRTLGMKRGKESIISGNKIHFVHLDRNRLDHAHINEVLQLAGVKKVDFTNKSHIIDV